MSLVFGLVGEEELREERGTRSGAWRLCFVFVFFKLRLAFVWNSCDVSLIRVYIYIGVMCYRFILYLYVYQFYCMLK